MATHLTRKELKQDSVALKVEETFGFLGSHRRQTIQIAGGVVALILVVAAVVFYRSSQREVRQQMLGEAITAQNAPVGAANGNGVSFPTEQAKKDAVSKAYQRLLTEHSGSDEAYIAEYSLASADVENGKAEDARKKFQDVADHAGANYASLAKLALAQLDFATGKASEGQSLLRDLMDHPTDLVSKNQAAYTLARGISQTNPEEARKLLLPLASGATEISQTAVTAISELPPAK